MKHCGDLRARRPSSIQPVVVELFAGAGLFGRAFQTEGFHLSRAYEQDAIAASTYARNLGAHIKVCDLAKHRPEGKADILIAGPPCQGFSSLGRRDPDDPRNDLGLIIPNWEAALRASIVVVENVLAYLKSSAWSRIRVRFERAGYEAFPFVLNAADFGVPQRRVRSFTVFSKLGSPVIKINSKREPKTVRQAFEGLPRFPDRKAQHFTLPRSEFALRRIQLVPDGGDIRDIARI